MELVASLPKPEGFFDPSTPAGEPTPPETTGRDGRPPAPAAREPPSRAAPPIRRDRWQRARTSRTRTWRSAATRCSSAISTASTPTTSRTRSKPRLLASVVCPGGQGDVSVYGNLLFMSVEQTRGRVDCGTQGVQTPVSAERFRGVRIFDITDLSKPKQVAAVQTCRGSHTHTLVTDPEGHGEHLRLRVRHEHGPLGRRARRLLGQRSEGRSEHRALQHRRHPGAARRARRRRASSTGRASSPTRRPATSRACGRAATTARARRRIGVTNQCHDITVFPELGLAAGACSGNGILLDISDPVHPVRLDRGRRTRTSPTGTRRRSTTTARR